MKIRSFILLTIFLWTQCTKEITYQTENATLYYDPSGVDNCIYTLQTDLNRFYTVAYLEEAFRINNLRVKISFQITNQVRNCGFSGPLTLIQIKTLEKI